MAHSAIEQGWLLGDQVLRSVASRHQVLPSQAALARVLRRDDICAISPASKPAHKGLGLIPPGGERSRRTKLPTLGFKSP
jgi:diketogulonate reductase-like aldo/keto reductase